MAYGSLFFIFLPFNLMMFIRILDFLLFGAFSLLLRLIPLFLLLLPAHLVRPSRREDHLDDDSLRARRRLERKKIIKKITQFLWEIV